MKIIQVCLLLMLIFNSCSKKDTELIAVAEIPDADSIVVDPVPDSVEVLLFVDEFDESSRINLRDNYISNPPPIGLGYPTDTPKGYELKHWIVADPDKGNNKKSFWCIPVRGNGSVMNYAQQSGRSRNSVAYANEPFPNDTDRYIIELQQRCNDNDYIGFIIGASEAVVEHDGVEFGYERQLPGTDETVKDVYLQGDLGEMKLNNQAHMKEWVDHRIEVKGKQISWYQDDELMATKVVEHSTPAGYFGIRQRFERGTRYDNVSIKMIQAQ